MVTPRSASPPVRRSRPKPKDGGLGTLPPRRNLDGRRVISLTSFTYKPWHRPDGGSRVSLRSLVCTGRVSTRGGPSRGSTSQANCSSTVRPGVTFNFENTATDYKTGDEFHFEWAIGREIATGLVLGNRGLRLLADYWGYGIRRDARSVQR